MIRQISNSSALDVLMKTQRPEKINKSSRLNYPNSVRFLENQQKILKCQINENKIKSDLHFLGIFLTCDFYLDVVVYEVIKFLTTRNCFQTQVSNFTAAFTKFLGKMQIARWLTSLTNDSCRGGDSPVGLQPRLYTVANKRLLSLCCLLWRKVRRIVSPFTVALKKRKAWSIKKCTELEKEAH